MVSYNLSVITISFNIADEIERTCKSIVNQSFQDFEWIVIDGGSTDGTTGILNKYLSRINVFVSEPDKGIFNAMNKGIKKSDGKYLLFLNGGDELYDNDSLNNLSSLLYSDFDLIACNEKIISGNNISDWIPTDDKTDFFVTTLPHQSTLINKRLFTSHGFYREDFKIAADYEFFVRVANKDYNYLHADMFLSIFYRNGISSNITELLKKENKIIKQQYFPFRYFFNNHKFLVESRNCIFHPRYFAGKIKQLFSK